MRFPSSVLVTLMLLAASCGDADVDLQARVAGTYVMGDLAEARKKTEPKPEDPNAPKTLAELSERMEKGETFTFSASTDIALLLHPDGSFEYYGPLKMGDEQRLTRGRWECDDAFVHLHLDVPQKSKGELVASMVCPYTRGVVKYPLGRDPTTQVYYRLLDPSRHGDLKPSDGGIQIGGEQPPRGD